jgi:alcohol dehydrogenase
MIRTEGERAIADAGLAAFGRALEAYIAPDRNPFMDAYAFAALRFIRENLITAVKNPNDKKASLAIANAAAMSGCAISNTGHGVLHRLGLVFHDMVNVHPGMIMGMCLIPVITDYLNKDSHLISTLLHPLTGDDKYAATPETKRAEATLSDLRHFLNDLYGILEDRRIRRTLKDVGISKYIMDDILEVLGREPDGDYLRTVIERVWDRPVKA